MVDGKIREKIKRKSPQKLLYVYSVLQIDYSLVKEYPNPWFCIMYLQKTCTPGQRHKAFNGINNKPLVRKYARIERLVLKKKTVEWNNTDSLKESEKKSYPAINIRFILAYFLTNLLKACQFGFDQFF